MLEKLNPEIYLQHKSLFFRVIQSETIGMTVYDLPDLLKWIAAYRCNKCTQIAIFEGEAECFDHQQREMGFETFYGSTDILYCPNCDEEITFESFISYYAMSWFCEFECDNAELVQINQLRLYLKALHESKMELRKLQSKEKDILRRLELLAEHAKKMNGYILIVEGDDDLEVWNRLLMTKNVDLTKIDIAKYGEGGMDAAIKAAKFFKGKVLKTIPHKLIIDSDNMGDEIKNKLRKSGIKSYHILEKKEIESYLIEPKALSQILNIDMKTIDEELNNIGANPGKEQLDHIFRTFTGKKATSSAKGLVAGALEKTPIEIDEIINNIKLEIVKNAPIIREYENYADYE